MNNSWDENWGDNEPDGTLDFQGFGTHASFFDYDNDGDLDVYLLNHTIHTPRNYGRADRRITRDEKSGDRLYENLLNEGTLEFIEVTDKAGIFSSRRRHTRCLRVSWARRCV